MEYRVVELFTDKGWQDVDFADLVKGDVFRMYEDEYKQNPVRTEDGCDVFVATSNPYVGANKMYEIECAPFEDFEEDEKRLDQ